MTNINVSYNAQFSILAIACLCSYGSIQEIFAKGFTLVEKEMLFLTFLGWSEEKLQSETTESDDYFFNIVDTVADEELFKGFFDKEQFQEYLGWNFEDLKRYIL